MYLVLNVVFNSVLYADIYVTFKVRKVPHIFCVLFFIVIVPVIYSMYISKFFIFQLHSFLYILSDGQYMRNKI